MSKNENRLNFRMTDETATKIERWYQEDNCRSKNEFIEKAVNCYADMLAAGESATLPRAVQSAIDARLKLFEDRIASLLYKQAVEMDMAMSIVLEMSRNVQSGNTQNLKSMVIQRSFPKWSVAERRKTAAASDQAAVCACAHSRYFTGGSPSGLRV